MKHREAAIPSRRWADACEESARACPGPFPWENPCQAGEVSGNFISKRKSCRFSVVQAPPIRDAGVGPFQLKAVIAPFAAAQAVPAPWRARSRSRIRRGWMRCCSCRAEMRADRISRALRRRRRSDRRLQGPSGCLSPFRGSTCALVLMLVSVHLDPTWTA